MKPIECVEYKVALQWYALDEYQCIAYMRMHYKHFKQLSNNIKHNTLGGTPVVCTWQTSTCNI